MACMARIVLFDSAGKACDTLNMELPEFLDWMPVEAKVYWFILRGAGNPEASHLLLYSQGEQQLAQITTPLQHFDYAQTKERDDNGNFERQVWDFCEREGLSRTPRNQ